MKPDGVVKLDNLECFASRDGSFASAVHALATYESRLEVYVYILAASLRLDCSSSTPRQLPRTARPATKDIKVHLTVDESSTMSNMALSGAIVIRRSSAHTCSHRALSDAVSSCKHGAIHVFVNGAGVCYLDRDCILDQSMRLGA